MGYACRNFNTDQNYSKGFKNQEVPFERQTLKLQKNVIEKSYNVKDGQSLDMALLKGTTVVRIRVKKHFNKKVNSLLLEMGYACGTFNKDQI